MCAVAFGDEAMGKGFFNPWLVGLPRLFVSRHMPNGFVIIGMVLYTPIWGGRVGRSMF